MCDSSHMLLLLKLQRDSNDVNYDAFHIPHCSLREVRIMSPCTDYYLHLISLISACVGESFEFTQTGAYSLHVMDIKKCFHAKWGPFAPLFFCPMDFLSDEECPIDFWKKLTGYFSFDGRFCSNRDPSQWAKNTEDEILKMNHTTHGFLLTFTV